MYVIYLKFDTNGQILVTETQSVTNVPNLVFFAVSMATAVILNFQAAKPFIHMPYNISIKFHPIPSTLNFSRFCANGGHSEISKPQNYMHTCQTKFLESFIQFRAP